MKTLRSQLLISLGLFLVCFLSISTVARSSQDPSGSLTPLQLEVEKQRLRLSSAEVEERRDAISRLASMQHPAASRAALAGLRDQTPVVRATSITAILSLPAEESSANLLPLLSDKDELVRREAAYALGTTRSVWAVPVLVDLLRNDKVDEVRGAAAVALGRIASEAAVIPLLNVLTGQADPTQKKKKAKREQNPFVLRSAARALGQIKSRSAVPVLMATLQDEKSEDDLRREAAVALGTIGDESALPALRNATSARDPHLAAAADAAIKDILRARSR
jgi:HEAT repeat protein